MARVVSRGTPAANRRVAGRAGQVLDNGIPVARRTRRRVVQEEVPVRSVVVEEPIDVVVDRPLVRREAWSPAQLVSMAVGAALLLLGAVALAKAASGAGGFTGHEVSVAGFHHTGMLGLIELFVGLTLIGIGAVPGGARQVMVMFGVLLAGFGLLVAVAGNDLHAALGTHGGHAVLYLLAGTLLIVAATVSPLVLPGTRRRVVEEPAIDLTERRL
ncbi:MAG TPA: hypothetical protein VMY88_12770 [Acidimicrobiales bacterium]|nr:hypothetical protein [Acidimicrobiales bacterium]